LKDAESASKSLWDNIRSAVQSRLVSDVPVGLFLSGGLDSTAIVAAACELREPASLPTFCIGFDDPTFDETPHARAVAEHLGTPLYEQRLSAKSMLNLLPQILAQLDEPLADPSLVPTSLLARFTRQHVKVALGGDGGDELFLGYPTFGAHRPAQVLSQIPRLVRRGLIQPAVQALPVSDNNWSLDYRLKRFVDGLDYDDIARHFIWIGGAAPDTHADLLEPAVYAATAGANPLDDIDRFRQERGVRSNDLDFVAYCYARLYLSDGVLQKVDRATMAHGLESRAPLLARNVLETAARIPTSLKLRGNSTKWILRQALRDRVPASILNRPKKGFGMPVGKWLKGPLLPLCQELLEPSALRKQALFKAESCQKLLNDHQSGWRDNRKVLWALIVFQLWLRHLE
jgi:asparagine synthase (glutamine-hydrolysing)